MPFGGPHIPNRRFYERIVRELEEMAEAVRHRPEINHQTAARLEAIAEEIRNDAKLDPSSPPRA